ncbi:MAG TPA: flagellar hook assembly protein FlgD [Polyangiaceae bacterium]|nr:flagellar hook assembly protein FlgD [Polyangiaceae bacterium]
MAVSSINGTDSANAAEEASSGLLTGANKGLGKDAFLKLLVAQIAHQDPLKPMDDTAFVAQLAQFSSLEQTMGINTRLDALAAQERGAQNTALAGLVGENVTVKGSITTLDSSGIGAPLSFTLGGDAKAVDVAIADQTGKTVRTLHLGPSATGLVRVTWDGRDDNGIAQPPGAYAIVVSAKSDADTAVDVSQESTGKLSSIDFSKGYPNLQLDNGVSAPASDLLRINYSANKQ